MMPPEDGEYLVYDEAKEMMTVSFFDGSFWGHKLGYKPNVTHWSKLPRPPHKDGLCNHVWTEVEELTWRCHKCNEFHFDL